jgi:hypothetical protein
MSAPKIGDRIKLCLDRPGGAYLDPIPKTIRHVRKDGLPTVNEGGSYIVVRSWVRAYPRA